MTYRELGVKDCALIEKVFNQSFSDGWNEEMLASGFESGALLAIGAFDGQKAVGAITFSTGLDVVDIQDVAVIPSERRKGIARELVSLVEERAKSQNADKIMLEVRESNVGAIALYGGLGFKKIAERKKYYQDGETALVMEKEIEK